MRIIYSFICFLSILLFSFYVNSSFDNQILKSKNDSLNSSIITPEIEPKSYAGEMRCQGLLKCYQCCVAEIKKEECSKIYHTLKIKSNYGRGKECNCLTVSSLFD